MQIYERKASSEYICACDQLYEVFGYGLTIPYGQLRRAIVVDGDELKVAFVGRA